MNYEPGECSEKAKACILDWTDKVGTSDECTRNTKYPFRKMLIGQSFAIPFGEVNEGNIRSQSTNTGVKLGKKFTVIKHNEYQCYEVARIA